MALKATIENFRVLQEVRFDDPGLLSIILGYNEGGKTTFINALKYACTGEAFGHRGKQTQPLITHGRDRAKVTLSIGSPEAGQITAKRDTSGNGDSLTFVAGQFGVPKELMPLLFDARLCGDGGNKALQKFLASAAVTGFQAEVHFAGEPRVEPYVQEALRAGKKTTSQIIDYCATKRAAQKSPPKPVLPDQPEPTDEELQGAFAHANTAGEMVRTAEAQLTAARTQGHVLTQIAQYLRELEAFEAARQAASVTDPLGQRRTSLQQVSGINSASLKAIAESLKVAGLPAQNFEAGIADLESAVKSAQDLLASNPAPPSMPSPPVLPTTAQAVWEGLSAKGQVVPETIAALAQANIPVETDATTAVENARVEKTTADNRYAAIVQIKGAWSSYKAAVPRYETEVEAAQARWTQWDTAIKQIEAAEAKHKAETGGVFGKMVSELSGELLQGREVILSDNGITLDNVAMEDCSESTKWRIEVSIMAAIALHLKSPILLLDGADILDMNNRESLTGFLLKRVANRFQHTILAMTTSQENIRDEKPLPSNIGPVSKWILEGGNIFQLEKTGEPNPVTPTVQPAPPPPPPPPSGATPPPPPPPPPPPGT